MPVQQGLKIDVSQDGDILRLSLSNRVVAYFPRPADYYIHAVVTYHLRTGESAVTESMEDVVSPLNPEW